MPAATVFPQDFGAEQPSNKHNSGSSCIYRSSQGAGNEPALKKRRTFKLKSDRKKEIDPSNESPRIIAQGASNPTIHHTRSETETPISHSHLPSIAQDTAEIIPISSSISEFALPLSSRRPSEHNDLGFDERSWLCGYFSTMSPGLDLSSWDTLKDLFNERYSKTVTREQLIMLCSAFVEKYSIDPSGRIYRHEFPISTATSIKGPQFAGEPTAHAYFEEDSGIFIDDDINATNTKYLSSNLPHPASIVRHQCDRYTAAELAWMAAYIVMNPCSPHQSSTSYWKGFAEKVTDQFGIVRDAKTLQEKLGYDGYNSGLKGLASKEDALSDQDSGNRYHKRRYNSMLRPSGDVEMNRPPCGKLRSPAQDGSSRKRQRATFDDSVSEYRTHRYSYQERAAGKRRRDTTPDWVSKHTKRQILVKDTTVDALISRISPVPTLDKSVNNTRSSHKQQTVADRRPVIDMTSSARTGCRNSRRSSTRWEGAPNVSHVARRSTRTKDAMMPFVYSIGRS